MKTKSLKGSLMIVVTFVCALWASVAMAVPNYTFYGYTLSLLLNEGEYQGYGYYKLGLTIDQNATGAIATSSFVDSLNGELTFMQDPFIYTDPNDPFLPTGPAINGLDFFLPNGDTEFGGKFNEYYALAYDSASKYLTLDFMDTNLQGLVPLLSFDLGLKGISSLDLLLDPIPLELTSALIGEGVIAGTIDPYLVDVTTDTVNPVPEPSTLILIGIGLAGLGINRRLRNRKQN